MTLLQTDPVVVKCVIKYLNDVSNALVVTSYQSRLWSMLFGCKITKLNLQGVLKWLSNFFFFYISAAVPFKLMQENHTSDFISQKQFL